MSFCMHLSQTPIETQKGDYVRARVLWALRECGSIQEDGVEVGTQSAVGTDRTERGWPWEFKDSSLGGSFCHLSLLDVYLLMRSGVRTGITCPMFK
jgi:hypothetical protein